MQFCSLLKRGLSALLILVMLMSILPTGIMAAEEAATDLPESESPATKALSTDLPDPEALLEEFNGLSAPTGAVKYGNELVDLTGYRTTAESHTALDFLTGRYYIVAEVDGVYYVFDAHAPTIENNIATIKSFTTTLDGNSFTKHSLKSRTVIFDFNYTNTNNDASYGLRLGHGEYIKRIQDADAKIVTSTGSVAHTGWIWTADEEKVIINDYYNTGKKRYCLAYDTTSKTFGWQVTTDADARTAGTDLNRFLLFRYCYRLDSLYSALDTMKSYLNRPEGASEEMYRNFLNSYRAALDLYEEYNVALTEDLYLESEYIQTKIDIMRNEILSYQKLLDSTLAYLDIPIQVLDFRADGYLFENPGTFIAPYNLSENSHAITLPDGTSLSRPGTKEQGENYAESEKAFYIAGLTEPELVNGSIVYTPEVIAYIANALVYYKDTNYGDPNPDKMHENWNDNFYYKKNGEGFTLGSWEETLAKINYTNGNHLSWDEVETAFDLAYYMLLYIWQPTQEGDALERGATVNSGTMDLGYNMVVSELQYLRLYCTDTEKKIYTFASSKSHSQVGGYIFNDGQSALSDGPGFNVVHHKGFENPDVFDVRTTGTTLDNNNTNYKKNANFFYSLHAESKFVYYKEKNYYFSFTGDDDVYFYINDKLICDIGGIHGSPKRSVYLEEKMEGSDQTYAEYLGLKDGDICSFDMFFADRHLTGINLAFETNIQLLNEDVLTEKHQYLVESEGQSVVSATNGMGEYLPDNGIVNIGDTVAYGFDLLNKGEVPVSQVSFQDESLGTELSTDKIILSDIAKTNGVSTAMSDLKLFYGPYGANAGTDLGGTAETIGFAELKALLEELNQAFWVDGDVLYPTFPQSLYYFTPTGSVTVDGKTYTETEQLQTLLELGVPAQGHLKVYGISRKTSSEDMPFRNVLRSACYDTVNGNMKIEGIARRSLRVPDLSNNVLPKTDVLELVVDYGKAVEIPIEHLNEQFYTVPSQSVGEFMGLVPSGSNGDFLRNLPANLYCTANGQQTMAKGNGIYTRTADSIVFTPVAMLSQVEKVYGVYAVTNCYGPGPNGTSVEYKYMLRELRITPATIMYYETDFASGIFELTQKGGDPWKTETDSTSAADTYQDYEPVSDIAYDKELDRKNIPDTAFFVDFDGEGYRRRYQNNPLYGGYDFDQEFAWYSHKTNNSTYNDHTLNLTAGTMELGNVTATSHGAWIQTIVPTTSLGSTPLNLDTGKGHFAQIRFRVENCKAYAGSGNISIFFSNSNDTENTEENVALDSRRARLALSNEEVLKGNYMTVRIPLDGTYYASSNVIDIMRVYIAGYTDDGSGKGKIYIDYIYVGPEMGMSKEVYNDYLFFDFTDTDADKLRYQSTAYGGMNFDAKNSDGTATNWAGRDTGFTKGTATISGGTLIVKPKNDTFGSIYADTQSGSNTATTHLINYDASKAEVFQYRFKVTGITDNDSVARATVHFYYESGTVSNPYDKHLESDWATFDSTYLNNGQWVTVQGTIPQTVRDKRYFDRLIFWIGGYPESGGSKDAVLTFDYIYIGPKSELDRINAAQSTQDKLNLDIPADDHLFFDFTNNNAAKTRYSNQVYNGTNLDLKENLHTNENYVILDGVRNGTLVLKDNTPNGDTAGANGNIFFQLQTLNYTPKAGDYCRIRLKIDGASKASGRSNTIRVDYYGTKTGNTGQKSTGSVPYTWDKVVDKGYFTVDIPMDSGDYLNVGNLKRINPVIIGTQGATITIDYVYVGPLTDANPADPSLYFGFEDTQEARLRYASDTYSLTNYDGTSWILDTPNHSRTFDSVYNSWTATNGTVSYTAENGYLEFAASSGSKTYKLQTAGNLDYHPANDNVAQIRFKTQGMTIGNDFALTMEYAADGSGAYSNAGEFVLSHSYELTPDKDYIVMNLKLGDTFKKAASVNGIRLNFKGLTADATGKILIDYIYVGEGKLTDPVYGYDSSYKNDSELSNGTSWQVEGVGVKMSESTTAYTEASFTFKGTGFDIISRTGPDQATIRVEVVGPMVDKDGNPTIGVVKRLTVNNKGELKLYQIPVVSVQGLPYAEYTVTLWVNKKIENSVLEMLNRGGQFHFDAVRIYDPLGESADVNADSLDTYQVDKEAYPHIKEVRNILLSESEFESIIGAGTGAIFVDMEETPSETVPATDADGNPSGGMVEEKPVGVEVTNHMTALATTYNKVGPKNEVYLAPGQAVAFKLQISTTLIPTSVDVGVKTIETNKPATLVAAVVKSAVNAEGLLEIASRREISLNSATAQYYALGFDAESFATSGSSRYCYIVLYNNGATSSGNVLSITDLKIAYDSAPQIGLPQDGPKDPEIVDLLVAEEPAPAKKSAETYFDFMVDGQTLNAAALVMRAELETPVLIDGCDIGHSLNLASDISVNYVVKKADLADYQNFYLECTIPGWAESVKIAPVEKGEYYYFTLEGLTAVQLNDVITATLRMEKDGMNYFRQADTYSIAQYAYAQMNKTQCPAALKTLCADLLRYGAKSQIFKGYATDRLADANMTEEQKTYLSSIENVTFGDTNRLLEDLEHATVTWVGKALDLESKVSLKLIFSPGDYAEVTEGLTLRVRYADTKGAEKTLILSNPEQYNEAMGYYAFTVDTLLAAELRSVISAQIYDGETPVSCTLQYSADTYGNNKTGALLDVCKALFAYSDSAKAYFAG